MQNDYPSSGATRRYTAKSNVKSQITSKGYPAGDSSEENILHIQGNKDIMKSNSFSIQFENSEMK